MAEECKPTTDILYHYTSIEAFRNIVESQKIRSTRYDQMNDASEVQLGIDNLLKAVKKHETDDSFRDYKDFLISGIEGYKEETLEVYVLSLSAAVNSLYQWRAYTPRGGIAIGFDSAKVRNGFLCDITRKVGGGPVANPIRPNPANQLKQCQYTDNNGHLDLRSIVAERFFRLDSYPSLYASQKPLAQKLFFSSLSKMIYQTICFIKHGA